MISGTLALLIALIALALIFDFLNGLHDAANSIATVVSTRVLSPHLAVLWAALERRRRLREQRQSSRHKNRRGSMCTKASIPKVVIWTERGTPHWVSEQDAVSASPDASSVERKRPRTAPPDRSSAGMTHASKTDDRDYEHVVALGVPSDRDRKAWYFQRYVEHLPIDGETVLFNRSWYNRAGVEPVMGFCTEDEYEEFMKTVPMFEQLLVHCGFTILKYYLDISRNK